jgi:hypothetical protein
MLANNEKDTFDKIYYLLFNKEYQHKCSKRMAKENNINVAYISYANHIISNNKSIPKRIRCKTYQYFHKGICFVEIGEISSNWFENTKKRIQKRIKRFNKFGRKSFITVIEFDQSTNNKKRKREKDFIIMIFTILTENIIAKFKLDDINRLD